MPSLNSCQTEFLSFITPECSLPLISLYHPFWNDKRQHEDTIQCITDITDHCLTNLLGSMRAKIVLCGDFNDLRFFSDDKFRLTGLRQIVHFPTRSDNVLDLIFTNFSYVHAPKRHPPIGKSDHVSIFWRPDEEIVMRTQKRKIRKMSKSAIYSFHCYVDSFDWFALIESVNDLINDAFEAFFLLLKVHSISFFHLLLGE